MKTSATNTKHAEEGKNFYSKILLEILIPRQTVFMNRRKRNFD